MTLHDMETMKPDHAVKPSTPKRPSKKRSAAIKIKRGNVTVKIHRSTTTAGGSKIYNYWTVVWYDGGKRMRQNFSDLEEAKVKAEEAATKVANGEAAALRLCGADVSKYVQAQESLKPLGRSHEVNLVVSEFVSATKQLPEGVTLRDVTAFWLERNAAGNKQKTVQQAVDEMIETKRVAQKSEVHLKDMQCRLGAFAAAFKMNLSDVSGQHIQSYLNGLGLSGRTQRNHLRHIAGLFQFAIKRKWLPKVALEELEAVEEPNEDVSEIGIFSPGELQTMFEVARPEMIPWLAIAAFAGLRSAELQRLDWSEVNLKERHIRITAAKAKTRSSRLVPIPDNLFAWLLPFQDSVGQVVPFENMANQIEGLVQEVNELLQERAETGGKPMPGQWQWKRNGLRHSYISYRLAIVKDVARVSLDAGNSPNMVFKHYRSLVTESEALKWFAVAPAPGENIVPMTQAA